MPEYLETAGALPNFKYHPDPISTGSIVQSSLECAACHSVKGWTYAGPVYGRFDNELILCPWCIADGTAHRSLGAEFVDPLGVGGYGDWDPVPQAVLEELCFRTPSFNGWQQEKWYTHCQDGAAFFGPVGIAELKAFDSAACDAISRECGFIGKELEDYMARLDRDGGPTAYIFRCSICGTWGGYSDTH